MDNSANEARQLIEKLTANIEKIIVGKKDVIRLAIITLMSQGHLLIADPPGVGKTMLARSIAKSINCTFSRIQFTPDMLPGDVTGLSIYNQKTSDFEFRPGPVMAQIVLADEINRANPRVQSALLECMGERQITVDGTTYPMPSPFHVIATENPIEFESTFNLPETQMDRFLMSINLGYPSLLDEMEILERQKHSHPIDQLQPVAEASDIVSLQKTVTGIHVDDEIKKYIVLISEATRSHPAFTLGASPRGSLALFRASQSLALMEKREYVIPDDIKKLVKPVLAHRVKTLSTSVSRISAAGDILDEIINSLPIPGVPHGKTV